MNYDHGIWQTSYSFVDWCDELIEIPGLYKTCQSFNDSTSPVIVHFSPFLSAFIIWKLCCINVIFWIEVPILFSHLTLFSLLNQAFCVPVCKKIYMKATTWQLRVARDNGKEVTKTASAVWKGSNRLYIGIDQHLWFSPWPFH